MFILLIITWPIIIKYKLNIVIVVAVAVTIHYHYPSWPMVIHAIFTSNFYFLSVFYDNFFYYLLSSYKIIVVVVVVVLLLLLWWRPKRGWFAFTLPCDEQLQIQIQLNNMAALRSKQSVFLWLCHKRYEEGNDIENQ